jgi:hypothetical protein
MLSGEHVGVVGIPCTIDEVLNDPLLTIEDRHDEIGSFAIKIGELQTLIFIELGRFQTSETTKFEAV